MARHGRRRSPGEDHRRLAELLVRLGRQYPLVTAVVLLVGLMVGTALWWRQHSQSAEQGGRRAPPAATLPDPPPTPAPPGDAQVASERLPSSSPHLLLGNPSGATTDPIDRSNYLLVKPQYALSYNDATGTPNWVSWRITAADLGDAPRTREFDPDEVLPAGFYRVAHRSYSASGFDRRHLCPHADRDATQAGAWSTFVMTNVIPQAPNVNQGAWAELEGYCRSLVTRQGMRLYVVAGPAGRDGRGSSGPAQTIDRGRVVVPASCWKVVVAVAEGGGSDDVGAVSADARVIAVVMPNDEAAIGPDWAPYRTTAAEVERLTGFRFFTRVPPDVAEALRGKRDAEAVALVDPAERR